MSLTTFLDLLCAKLGLDETATFEQMVAAVERVQPPSTHQRVEPWPAIRARTTTLEAQVAHQRGVIASLEAQNKALVEAVDRANKRASPPADCNVEHLQSAIHHMRATLLEKDEEIAAERSKLADAQKNCKAAIKAWDIARGDIAAQMTTITQQRAVIDDLRAKLAAVESGKRDVDAAYKKCWGECRELRAKVADLEEDLKMRRLDIEELLAAQKRASADIANRVAMWLCRMEGVDMTGATIMRLSNGIAQLLTAE